MMSNKPPSDGHDAADQESFEEWLDQAAESKGVSRGELMNQMLSSYWILNELTGLVGETEAIDAGKESPLSESATSEGGADSPDGGADAMGDGNDTENNSEADSTTEETLGEIKATLQELAEGQRLAAEERSAEPRSQPQSGSGIVAVVSDLQRQVGSFDTDLQELEERQNSQFDRLSSELQLLGDRVGELELGREEFAHGDDLKTLETQIEADLDDIEQRLDRLESSQDDLEARINREFDSIEALFERLLDTIDELDGDIEAMSKTHEEDVDPLKERETTREALEALKREAIRREIRRGTCESCGKGVDLAMLESPACPNCEARFTGVKDSGWNPFASPTLNTGPIDDR